jgi:hypothetical protein
LFLIPSLLAAGEEIRISKEAIAVIVFEDMMLAFARRD